MRSLRWIFVTILALAVFGPAAAQSDTPHVVKGHLFWSNPTGDGPRGIEGDAELGFDLGYEYRWSDQIGFDAVLAFVDYDLDPGDESVDTMPLVASLLFHVTPDARYDIYVGPSLGFVFYDDIGSLDTDNDFALGAKGGIALPLQAENLSLSFEIRYLRTAVEVEDAFDIDLDPLTFAGGLAYRF